MNSYLPSAWQSKNKHLCIVPDRNAGLNVFGLLNRDMDFYPYTTKQSMTSSLTIAFIDDFIKHAPHGIKVIVLDNAPIHHSEEFKDQIERWKEQDLYIFYLPTYSPHLNIIEILWRKIKYEWLEQNHSSCSNVFYQQLEFILLNIGSQFNINFKNQLLPD